MEIIALASIILNFQIKLYETTNVVEYSFNGTDLAGELVPYSPSSALTFNNRVISAIWFRVKTGSTAPVVIRVDAWN